MAALPENLRFGIDAIKQGQFSQAVQALEACLQETAPGSKSHLQTQMHLVEAYRGNGQGQQARTLCQTLAASENSQVQQWAQQVLQALPPMPPSTPAAPPPAPVSAPPPGPPSPAGTVSAKAGRATAAGVKVAMAGVAGNLALASGVTLSLLFGMVFVLCLGLIFITDSGNPGLGLVIATTLTILFNVVVFFLSPFLMDLSQKWLYKTHWISLMELEHLSPETSQVLQRVCAERNLKMPRIGIIEDENPTAFTYGSLPNTARLVVSRGLFTYLDDDEVATVYAHELGHIVHWDFAVMTLAATLVQITYLIYIFARRMMRGGNSKAKSAAQTAALTAYIFYVVGTYLVKYLSRTREYFADHFAAETTGNPNGLSRALVKIAYGIVEEGQRSQEPSRLLEGTRALGIYDAKAATSSGTAYRVSSSPEKIGRVFLWDLFNPWGWWMELQSTHPLTGKRVRALSTYAEQLGIDMEYDMGRVVQEGNQLSKGKLYGNFAVDLVLYCAEILGIVVGLILGGMLYLGTQNPANFLSFGLMGLGAGVLCKTFVMYPNFNRAQPNDILTLMSNPYASPLRGQPVQIQGKLIGRGDAGYAFGSDLKLQDKSGMIFLRYASRFGPIGNFLFGMSQVKDLIGSQVGTTGWFRRGIAPWMDLVQFETGEGRVVNSYHRFWSFIWGGLAIAAGLVLLILFQ